MRLFDGPIDAVVSIGSPGWALGEIRCRGPQWWWPEDRSWFVGSPDHSKVLDIMMLAVTGGRERTREQYEKLLAETGFELQRVVPTRSSYFIVEATAV